MNRLALSRLALFDCDGTLVDSQANICTAMEQAFASASLPAPPREAIRRVVGLSLFEVMRALLPDAEEGRHRALAEGYRAAFVDLRQSDAFSEEPLFDGVGDVLETLADAGWLLGVATGKSDRGLAHVLDRHGIADRFVTLQTADRHPSKPHPSMVEAAIAEAGASPATTVMIGDTSYDMMMARAAGVRAVGVTWGYHACEELIAATRIVASLGAILGVVLLARASDWPNRMLGVAIVLAALYMVATVPAALAHRWRSPPQP